jgi:hypothetical protein
MKIEKRMVPEYGVTLDGVWLPYNMLEELESQAPLMSDFGNAFISPDREQGAVLIAQGLAVRETRGGYRRGEKLRQFLQGIEWEE